MAFMVRQLSSSGFTGQVIAGFRTTLVHSRHSQSCPCLTVRGCRCLAWLVREEKTLAWGGNKVTHLAVVLKPLPSAGVSFW